MTKTINEAVAKFGVKMMEIGAKAERQRMWIPVSERLPEQRERVLVTISTPHKGKNVRSGTFYDGCFMNDNGDTWNATDPEVIAWMPSPEPYTEQEDES